MGRKQSPPTGFLGLVSRYQDAVAAYERALSIRPLIEQAAEHEQKLRRAITESSGTLENAFHSYLKRVRITDPVDRLDNQGSRVSFDKLLHLMKKYADPKLDDQTASKCRELRSYRDHSTHKGLLVPPIESVYESLVSTRQLILRYFEVTPQQFPEPAALVAEGPRASKRNKAMNIRVGVVRFEHSPHSSELSSGAYFLASEVVTQLWRARASHLNIVDLTSIDTNRFFDLTKQKLVPELRVDYLISGNVHCYGDTSQVTVKLLRSEDHLIKWTETFTADQPVFLGMQTVGAKIAQAVGIKLSPERKDQGLYTDNAKAYESYCEGRRLWNERTPGTIKSSIDWFRDAAREDPGFVVAYTGIAEALIMASTHALIAPDLAFPQARSAAHKALSINPDIGEAYVSLGWCHLSFDKDWITASHCFEKALELSPNYFFAYNACAYLAVTLGDVANAVKAFQKASEFDPLSPALRALTGNAYYMARKWEKAVEVGEKVCKEYPGFALGRSCLGLAYGGYGDHLRAIAEHETALKIAGPNPICLGFLGYEYGAARERTKAEGVLRQMKAVEQGAYVPGYMIALVSIGLEDREGAIPNLQRAFVQHDPWLAFAMVDPKLDAVRGDERFDRIIANFKLPESVRPS